MNADESRALKALLETHRRRAPGHVRRRIADAIPALKGRATKSDWRRLMAQLPAVGLVPSAGRMWFPVVFEGDVPGTIATVEVATLEPADVPFNAGPGARVRRWLAQTLGDALNMQHTEVSEHLANIALTWRLGAEDRAPGVDDTAVDLQGESMDLATALAFVGHLSGRSPLGAWVVSGALAEPGKLKEVDYIAKKRVVVADEAPDLTAERCIIIESPCSFLDVAASVYGAGITTLLGLAFGQSAVAALDRALGAWRSGNEQAAATHAAVTLHLAPTPGQAAVAHLILGADAIHRGALADADSHLAYADTGAPQATHQDGWSFYETQELKVRQAVVALDRLRLQAAITWIDAVVASINGVPSAFRTPLWPNLAARAHGTRSTILAAMGQLDEAIAARRAALELGSRPERARSLIELARLQARVGAREEARQALETAKESLTDIADAQARRHTARFWLISAIRDGLVTPSIADVQDAAGSTPRLSEWPQPSMNIALLLINGDEGVALKWFEDHVFIAPLGASSHPAYLHFFVTSAARAVACGFESPRWREGVTHIVETLAAMQADPGLVGVLRCFVAGGDSDAVLRRAIY